VGGCELERARVHPSKNCHQLSLQHRLSDIYHHITPNIGCPKFTTTSRSITPTSAVRCLPPHHLNINCPIFTTIASAVRCLLLCSATCPRRRHRQDDYLANNFNISRPIFTTTCRSITHRLSEDCYQLSLQHQLSDVYHHITHNIGCLIFTTTSPYKGSGSDGAP
jgi:hypothetical protein